jgi:hypothetical protein
MHLLTRVTPAHCPAQAARAEGVSLPDVLRRGRHLAKGGGDGQYGGCPPYHGTVPSKADVGSDAMLDVLGKYRVSLVTISYRSPLSLEAAAAKWEKSGLLDLVSPRRRMRVGVKVAQLRCCEPRCQLCLFLQTA